MHDHSEERAGLEAVRLVEALDSLLDGEGAVTALVALGPPAIPPLRRFLLDGRPSTVYQPRRWAVQALASLNAREALMEYLSRRPPADPQLRFAEDAVRNAAIREFLRWPDEATFAFLLDLSRRTVLPALAEVFGKLRLVEAIPFLDRALEDDLCRQPAEEALAAIGEPAREALILSALFPLPAREAEKPSSLRRRQSALRVLLEIGIRREDWSRLGPLLQEEDPELALLACALAVKSGARQAASEAIPRLIELSAYTPWYLNEIVVDCLIAWWDEARPTIEAEAERRSNAPQSVQITDQTLRLLLRVIRCARQAHPGASPPAQTERDAC